MADYYTGPITKNARIHGHPAGAQYMANNTVFRIAVCDDDKMDQEQLTRLVREWSYARDIRCTISAYDSADALLAAQPSFDLLFLDILMEGQDGMHAARLLRETGNEAQIVFVSCTADYVFEGYEVDAYRYILKPYDSRQITDILDKCYAGLRAENLLLRCGSITHVIRCRDILYVEAQGRRCDVISCNERLNASQSISELASLLPQDSFFHCSKSFIVNLRHVAGVQRYEALLQNGARIPVSRRLYGELKTRLLGFLSGRE